MKTYEFDYSVDGVKMLASVPAETHRNAVRKLYNMVLETVVKISIYGDPEELDESNDNPPVPVRKTYDVTFRDGSGINKKIVEVDTIVELAMYMQNLRHYDIISIVERKC